MGLLIFYLLLALLISFICSVLEAVLLSVPPSYIEILRHEARKEAGQAYTGRVKRKLKGSLLLRHMKSDVEKPLSAILSLNTVAHTVGAAGVGAQSLELFGDVYVGVTSAILTLLILVLSEILPKSVGTHYWKTLAVPTAFMVRGMVVLCYPLVWLSEGISWLVSREKRGPSVSREEVEAVVKMGAQEGIFEQQEGQSLRSMLAAQNCRVRDVMTPRIVAVTVSEEMSLREFYRKKNYLKYSRIPVYKASNPEQVTGFVLLKSIFMELAEDQFDKTLKSIRRPIMVVSDAQRVFHLWEQMQKKREHIALVVDEYGTFVGIVTLEDVVETMLGREIVDEKDTITDLQAYARKKSRSE